MLRMYANAEGDNTSVQDAETGMIDRRGAFDAAGNLLVPMEVGPRWRWRAEPTPHPRFFAPCRNR